MSKSISLGVIGGGQLGSLLCAAAKKIDFIIDGSTSLLYGNPNHDLTDDVLLELRKYSVSDKKKTDTKN